MQRCDQYGARYGLAASSFGNGLSRDPAVVGATSEVVVFSLDHGDEESIFFFSGIRATVCRPPV